VLEVYDENARGIDKLSNNMMTFMNQLLGHLGERLPQEKIANNFKNPGNTCKVHGWWQQGTYCSQSHKDIG
jgi:hypothetical protein